MNNETTKNSSYLKLVEAARELARHALRTRNTRAQVEAIGALNLEKSNLLKEATEYVKACVHAVEKATYQLAKLNLDANLGDPDFAENVKEAETFLAEMTTEHNEAVKVQTAITDGSDEQVKNLNKQIAEAETKIERWATGENKVQLENVNKLAQEYVEKALNERARGLSSLLG
jgi:uncharacterized protein (DUF305 family)